MQASPELPSPFVVVLASSGRRSQLGRIFRRGHRPEMPQRPEAGQPGRTVVLREKVSESSVSEVPLEQLISGEQISSRDNAAASPESIAGARSGSTAPVR